MHVCVCVCVKFLHCVYDDVASNAKNQYRTHSLRLRQIAKKMLKITDGPWINHVVNCMFSTLDNVFCTEDWEPDPECITFRMRGSIDTCPLPSILSLEADLLLEWIPGITGWAVLSWYTELFCAGLEMKCECGGGPC